MRHDHQVLKQTHESETIMNQVMPVFIEQLYSHMCTYTVAPKTTQSKLFPALCLYRKFTCLLHFTFSPHYGYIANLHVYYILHFLRIMFIYCLLHFTFFFALCLYRKFTQHYV